jgi:hypothetical protein
VSQKLQAVQYTSGDDRYRSAVRSAIKNIRKKFCACDPGFDQVENYSGLRLLLAQGCPVLICFRSALKAPVQL